VTAKGAPGHSNKQLILGVGVAGSVRRRPEALRLSTSIPANLQSSWVTSIEQGAAIEP
jgi:hypothetical protein